MKHRFHTLNGMRGLAAIFVMFFHYFSLYGVKWLMNGFIAVDFFFVLSGFVVRHSYGEKLLSGMPWRDYLARRVARLFPLMAFGIALGVPAICLAPGHFSSLDTIFSTLTNLCFLPYLGQKATGLSIVPGLIFPADDPLWSIFFEMVASVVFIWFVRLGSRSLLILAASAFVLASGISRAFDHLALQRRIATRLSIKTSHPSTKGANYWTVRTADKESRNLPTASFMRTLSHSPATHCRFSCRTEHDMFPGS